MNGYAGVVQALASTQISWPGFARENPLELAQFVPGRIWRAFVVTDPKLAKDHLAEMKLKPPGDDPAFNKAYENWAKASKALIDAALPDQDEIIGAYFCGHLPPRTDAPAPWATSRTYVERLMNRKPDLFKAAAANEDAMKAIREAGKATPATARQSSAPAQDPVTAAKDTCIETLRIIDSAKQQWALEYGRRVTDTPSWSDLQPYFGRWTNGVLPKCPSGGTYTIGTIGERPTCSIPRHVLQ
jgi:hypothetical protein